MSVHLEGGRWYVRFQINGTRIRKAIKEARTKKQAERAEQVLRNELFEKRWGDGGQRNFAEFVENTYKPDARQHKKGYAVELSVLNALVQRFGKFRLCEITPQQVIEFQQQRASEITIRGAKRSRATVNRDMAVLSAIFKLATRLGDVRENPVSRIRYFGNLPKRDRVLSDEEEIALLNSLSDDIELRSKIEILLYTGLRRQELFSLQWRDIDFENGVIRLRPETTKTARPRTIPMFSNVRRIFSYLQSQTENDLPLSLVFPGVETRKGSFSAQLKRATKALGIHSITAHSLRHTFSTRANRFGVDPFAQKESLGHSKLTQTADYTHQSSETFLRNFQGFEQHLLNRQNVSLLNS
jgi:integrase